MILPKKQLVSRGVISGVHEIQMQPAGIDLSLKEVYAFASSGAVDFDNSQRKIADVALIQFEEEWVHLAKGCYKVVYNEIVKIPIDCVALGYPRSSLIRNGAHVGCAVWEPGYEGRSESLLIVENENGIKLKRNARVVQLVFVQLAEGHGEVYTGRYQKENI